MDFCQTAGTREEAIEILGGVDAGRLVKLSFPCSFQRFDSRGRGQFISRVNGAVDYSRMLS